eukprot:6958327-Pyramimonas_sp.AAC.1
MGVDALSDDVVGGGHFEGQDTGCSSSPVLGGVRTLCPSRCRGSGILSQMELVRSRGVRSQNPDGEGSSTSPLQ